MVDLWCVALVHKEVILTWKFMCRTLWILQPHGVCMVGKKVTTLLQKGYFSKPGINLRTLLKNSKQV